MYNYHQWDIKIFIKGGHVYIIVTSKCCVSGRSIYPEQNTYQRRDYNYVNRNKNYHGNL